MKLSWSQLTFLLCKGVKPVLKRREENKTHEEKRGIANLLMNLLTFNYLGSKNFLNMNDRRKLS